MDQITPLSSESLRGKRVAVFVEHKFIPEEIEAYRTRFAELGAEVDFVSRLHYGSWQPASVTFYSDNDPSDNAPFADPVALDVSTDVAAVDERLEEYAAVVMAANYTSVRLRYADLPPGAFDAAEHVRSPPVVRLFARAMLNRKIVKGALCHGLWILTPHPDLLKGRRVICHSVVMADVLSCGAVVDLTPSRVVVDDDLVTGFSKHEALAVIDAIARQVLR